MTQYIAWFWDGRIRFPRRIYADNANELQGKAYGIGMANGWMLLRYEQIED